MKKADLKEFIKQTMLETTPKKDTGAMTPEEEKMVADYEEEEANKYALDKEQPLEEVIRKTDSIIESWNKRRKLTETSTDPALEVVDWEETPKGDVRVKTADGTEEIYKFGSSDEELDYHASSQGSTAYETYYNDDLSKELTMKVEVWGNPDFPNRGDLDFVSLEYAKK